MTLLIYWTTSKHDVKLTIIFITSNIFIIDKISEAARAGRGQSAVFVLSVNLSDKFQWKTRRAYNRFFCLVPKLNWLSWWIVDKYVSIIEIIFIFRIFKNTLKALIKFVKILLTPSWYVLYTEFTLNCCYWIIAMLLLAWRMVIFKSNVVYLLKSEAPPRHYKGSHLTTNLCFGNLSLNCSEYFNSFI